MGHFSSSPLPAPPLPPSLTGSPAPAPPAPPARRSGGPAMPPPEGAAICHRRAHGLSRSRSRSDRGPGGPRWGRPPGAGGPGLVTPGPGLPDPDGGGAALPEPTPTPAPCPGHGRLPRRPRAASLAPANPGVPAVAAVNGSRRPRRPQPGLPLQRAPPSRPVLSLPPPPESPCDAAPAPGARTMAKSRLRMFLNELKLLVLTGGAALAEPQPRGAGRRLRAGHPFAGCSARDGDGDEEEYYGSEPRARAWPATRSRGPDPRRRPRRRRRPRGALDALSLSSSLDSGLRTLSAESASKALSRSGPGTWRGGRVGRAPGASGETGSRGRGLRRQGGTQGTWGGNGGGWGLIEDPGAQIWGGGGSGVSRKGWGFLPGGSQILLSA